MGSGHPSDPQLHDGSFLGPVNSRLPGRRSFSGLVSRQAAQRSRTAVIHCQRAWICPNRMTRSFANTSEPVAGRRSVTLVQSVALQRILVVGTTSTTYRPPVL